MFAFECRRLSKSWTFFTTIMQSVMLKWCKKYQFTSWPIVILTNLDEIRL